MYRELLITTVATAVLVYSFPRYLTLDRFSRSVLRFLIVDAILLFIWRVFIYPFFFNPLRNLPGPTSYNLLFGNASAQFSKPPGEAIRKWSAQIPNDGLLRFRGLLNEDRLVCTTPETLKSVMADNSYDFEKPNGVRKFLELILGNGLIMSEGSLHKFQRKHLLPAFQVQHIRELYPVFWDRSRGLVEAIEADIEERKRDAKHGEHSGNEEGLLPVIEFGDWATRVTLDIIGIAGMGRDFGALRNSDDPLVRDYNSLLEPTTARSAYFAANILGPQDLIQKLPFGQTIELKRITSNLKKFCLEHVKEKRQISKETKANEDTDILSLLIRSNDFNDADLVDQLLTFLAAGHETTSSALTWAIYLLAIHPTWQTALRSEVRTHLPPLSTPTAPTSADIEALPILNAIINETLRLYPTVPLSIRTSVRPTTISVLGNPLPIPAGTRIMLVPWATNRSPLLWGAKATEFTPERWLQPGTQNTGGAESNYANLTFFYGPRSCIGQGFARAEFKCLLAALAGGMRWEMANGGEEVFPAGVVTTKPAGGMHVRMERVEGW